MIYGSPESIIPNTHPAIAPTTPSLVEPNATRIKNSALSSISFLTEALPSRQLGSISRPEALDIESLRESSTTTSKTRLQYSKALGATYLWGRIFEYIFKGVAVALTLKNQNSTEVEQRQALALLITGLACGEIGNIFQAYQGGVDWNIAEQFPEEFADSDKAPFGKIAIARGSINLVSDSTALVAA